MLDQNSFLTMTPFLFNRELDYQYLDARYQDDLYLAREMIGSICETLELDLHIMESALEQKRIPAFLRICQRLTKGLEAMGLNSEIEQIQVLRSHFAFNGPSAEFYKRSSDLADRLRDLKSLFMIEQQRLESHLEQRIRHS